MNRQMRRAYSAGKTSRSFTGMPKTHKPLVVGSSRDVREEDLTPRGTPGDVGDVHPGRYPRHEDPHKGQVFGGTCNTTLCNSERAEFFNAGTYGLYCVVCARGQNGNDVHKICTRVPAKPSFAEMAEMNSLFMSRLRG
jgi:hypothetical protein